VVFVGAYHGVYNSLSLLVHLLLELSGQFYEYDDIFTLIKDFAEKECSPAASRTKDSVFAYFFDSFLNTFLSLLEAKGLSRNILFIFDQLNTILSDASILKEEDRDIISTFLLDLSKQFNCVFVWSANNENIRFPLSLTWGRLEKNVRLSKDELKPLLSFYSDLLKEPIDPFDEPTFKIIDYYTSCIPFFVDLFLSMKDAEDPPLSLKEMESKFRAEFSKFYKVQKLKYIEQHLKLAPDKINELNQNLAYSIFLKGYSITKSETNIIIDKRFFEIEGAIDEYTLVASTPFIEYIEWKNYIDDPDLLHLQYDELARKIETSLSFVEGSGKGQLFEKVFMLLLLSSRSLSFQVNVDHQTIDLELRDLRHCPFSNLDKISFSHDGVYYPSSSNYPLVDVFIVDKKNKQLFGIQMTLDVEGHCKDDMNLSHKRLDLYKDVLDLCEKNGFGFHFVYASTFKQFSLLGKDKPKLNCLMLDRWSFGRKFYSLF